jgi:NADH:ubiquinone oxidoreductase subunit F (NADH-binding)
MELTSGPPWQAGAESLTAHRQRLGALPQTAGPPLIAELDASRLVGRGGAGFPAGRKWRSVAERFSGPAVVLVNGAEGEPLSAKDRSLLTARPHLVIDGALLAARAIEAQDIVFYVGRVHQPALAALRRALAERPRDANARVRVVEAPARYVAGEESAAVHFVNAGDARPLTTPARPFERGIGRRPTLVQNVETLAMAALIARGRQSRTGLLTLSGAVPRSGVREIAFESTLGEAVAATGDARPRRPQAVLLGGYFGAWVAPDDVWALPLDPHSLRARGLAFGCGVVQLLPTDACGVEATSRIMATMASESARQCGPCLFGLRAIAAASHRLATGAAEAADLERLQRWSSQLGGRGACKHPDGAVGLLKSALDLFAEDFAAHQRRRCVGAVAELGVA